MAHGMIFIYVWNTSHLHTGTGLSPPVLDSTVGLPSNNNTEHHALDSKMQWGSQLYLGLSGEIPNFHSIDSISPGWWLGHPSEKYESVNWDD